MCGPVCQNGALCPSGSARFCLLPKPQPDGRAACFAAKRLSTVLRDVFPPSCEMAVMRPPRATGHTMGECRPKTLFAGPTRQAAGEFCRNTQVKREVIHLSTRLSTMPAFYAVKTPQKRVGKERTSKEEFPRERAYIKSAYINKKAAYNTAEWQKRACPVFIPQSVCRRLRGFDRRRHRAVVLPANPPQIGIIFERADTM